MEVSDQRHVDPHAVELLADRRHGLRSLWRIDRDADHLRSGQGQFLDLNGRANHVFGIGIGHRLHTHRCATTDRDDARTPGDLRLAGGPATDDGGRNGLLGIHLCAT